MDVATLYKHLGGDRFFLYTGFVAEVRGDNYVQFKAKKNKLGANKMKISLVNDTYTIEFGKIRSMEYKVVKTIEDVYASNLAEIFERETGLLIR